MINLYPDQEEFINEIRKCWKHHKRIVGMLPTGGGKTFCAARIISGLVKNNMRVAFLVPRITLIEQTARSFMSFGIDDITVMQGQREYNEQALVTIASIDTFIRRDKREFDLVIVDECHHRRKQVLEWMTEHPHERYLGLTATPFAPWLGTYYTALAKGKSMRWLIDNNRLSDYDVYAPSVPDTSKLKTRMTAYGKDYAESDLDRIMGDNKVVGCIVSNWIQNADNKLTMALCVNVNHANQICNEFEQCGVGAEVVSANVPLEEREMIFQRMRDGITKVVLSVDCLTEGFDLPEVEVLINARPTKSLARWIQGAGRALRYLPDKRAIIFDHSGTALDLGFPCSIEIDDLQGSSQGLNSSQNVNTKEKKETKPKKCKQCGYLKEKGGECPKCGYTPRYGEDVETDKSRSLEKIKGKEKSYTVEQKQDWYSMFVFHARKKGYSAGWAYHKYKEKFKVAPCNKIKRTEKEPTPEFEQYIKHLNIRFARRRK